ncbi:hypothetical protein LR48_Vigan452s001000 [Vigna angularis]|uniref:Uncharacterized protein n=1 Tax=Phaseolus angularis TaxID=3914 RepID=A0A0L9TBE9_PHAAN|nr:hypothetical protein LR48_Vigan452s001000 [Vigna angularis]
MEDVWQQKNGRTSCLGRENGFLENSSPFSAHFIFFPRISESQILHLLSKNHSPSLFCNSLFSTPFTFQHRENDHCNVSFIWNRAVLDSETGKFQTLHCSSLEGDMSLEQTLEEEVIAEDNLVEVEVKAEYQQRQWSAGCQAVNVRPAEVEYTWRSLSGRPASTVRVKVRSAMVEDAWQLYSGRLKKHFKQRTPGVALHGAWSAESCADCVSFGERGSSLTNQVSRLVESGTLSSILENTNHPSVSPTVLRTIVNTGRLSVSTDSVEYPCYYRSSIYVDLLCRSPCDYRSSICVDLLCRSPCDYRSSICVDLLCRSSLRLQIIHLCRPTVSIILETTDHPSVSTYCVDHPWDYRSSICVDLLCRSPL